MVSDTWHEPPGTNGHCFTIGTQMAGWRVRAMGELTGARGHLCMCAHPLHTCPPYMLLLMHTCSRGHTLMPCVHLHTHYTHPLLIHIHTYMGICTFSHTVPNPYTHAPMHMGAHSRTLSHTCSCVQTPTHTCAHPPHWHTRVCTLLHTHTEGP